MNFVQLGIEVKSESAVQAADDLDKLVDSGKSAEDSARRVGAAWEKAVTGISSDTGQIVQELKLLNARQDSTAQLMAKLAQSVADASKAFTTASVGAKTMADAGVKVGESADQAKARLLALATAAVDSAKSQEVMGRAYEATAGSAAAAMRAQLDQAAAQSRFARVAATAAAEQEQLAAAERKATGATSDQAKALEKLLGTIDPTIAAFARLEKQQEELAKFKASGILPADDFDEYSAKIQASRAALGGFDDGLSKTGMSAKATAAALRGVPAQFTDIFTSLAAGQQPLTVFLQQGGQLKDMFGGVGEAAKALGGYVLGLVNPFSVAAAAAAALGASYYYGSKEADAYRNALINTGNEAGTTASAMADLAEKVGDTVGNTGKAADALAQIAASGKIASSSFETIATAAVASQEATGRAVSETIAEFVKIAQDPVSAAKTLNDQYNFLTGSIYQQITALKGQGKEQQAVTLLTDTYAAAIKARTTQVASNLGYIERAWAAIKRETLATVDAALNVGRLESTANRIAELQQKVAAAQSALNADPDDTANRKKLQDSKLELDFLIQQRDAQASIAAAEALRAERQQKGIEASERVNEQLKQTYGWQQKIEEANKKIDADVAAAAASGITYTAKQIQKLKEAAAKQFKPEQAASAPVDLSTFNEAENALKSLVSNYQNSMRLLDASLKAGVITQQDYTQQKSALINKERADVEEGYQAQITALQGIADKSSTTGAQRIQIDQRIADTRQKMTQALQKLDADQQVLSLQSQERLKKEAAAIEAYGQALEDNLKRTQDSLDLQLAGFGLGERARQQLQEMLKIRQDYEKDLEKLERDHRLKRVSDNEYAGQKVELEQWLAQRLQMQEQYYKEEDALRSDWQNGVSRAYNSYIEETRDIAGQTENLFSDALHGIDDLFADLAVNGKASFKDLADSIIADLARMASRAYITIPLLNAMGMGGSPGGMGGVSSLLSGSPGASSGGGIASLFDMGTKAYGVANSGFGQAVSAGWNAGQGFMGGMEGAISGGYNYVSSGLSSLFGSGGGAAGQMANGVYQMGANTGAATVDLISNTVTNGAGQVTGSASGMTQLPGADYLGPIAAGIGGAIQGYQQAGLKGAATGAGGAVAGAYIGQVLIPIPGVGAAIGAMLGSMLGSSVWSGDWVTKDQGYQLGVENGDFDAMGFEYQKKKGGLFGKNKKRTKLTELDPVLQATLDASYATTVDKAVSLFEQLNVEMNEGVLDGLNVATTQISTKDRTQEEIQALFTDFFNQVGNSAVDAIAAATGTQLDPGTTLDGLNIMVGNLFTINNALDMVNVGLIQTSVYGMKMANQLQDMAGGMEAFSTNVSGYYENFFTETEKADDTLKAVNAQFAALNLALPDSRQGFRDVVEGIDVQTEAGRAMFTTLMGLSQSAAAAYTILEQRASEAEQAAAAAAQAIIDGLMGAVSNSNGSVQRAIAAEQKATTEAYNARVASLNDMAVTARESVSGLTSVGNDLGSALKALRGDSDDAVKMLRSQAQATLQSALTTARAGGSLANFSGLSDALDTLGSKNTDLYGSMEDFQRDQGRTANVVAELNALNGKQLSSAERSVKTLEDQLDQAKKAYDAQMAQFDQQLEFAQAQMDALNGVDNSVKSVADAVKAMNASVVAALAGLGGSHSTAPGVSKPLIESAYREVLDREADAAGLAYWQQQLASGAISYGQLEEAIRNAAKANGQLPAFASGGLISGPGTGTSDSILARLSNGEYVMSADAVRMFGTGLLDQMNAGRLPAFARGGPVLDIPSPAQAFGPSRSLQQPGAGNDAAAAEIKALKDEVQNLTRQIIPLLRQTADHTGQLAESGTQIVGTVDTRVVSA